MKKPIYFSAIIVLLIFACSSLKSINEPNYERYCLMDSLLWVDKSIDSATAMKIINKNPLLDSSLWKNKAYLERIVSKKFKRFKLIRTGISKDSTNKKDTCDVIITDNAGWIFEKRGSIGCHP